MRTVNKTVQNTNVLYPLEQLGPVDHILFIDIETTGFSAKTSQLYLIGCLYYRNNEWNTIQFFAEDYSDEKELIEEFFSFAHDYEVLIHFNGNNFDLPYIIDKCKQFELDYNFDTFVGIDIYKRIKPYKNLLKLENCKQKTIEQFLKIDRDDVYSGGELISKYHTYVADKSDENLNLLLLHNYDDLQGMLKLVPVLAYSDLMNSKITVTKVSANYYTDENGSNRSELLMVFTIENPIPVPISSRVDGCYFTCNGTQGLIKVPLYKEELKYFYANYHDYYYLPDEDMAIHKSVAEFVDKAHREKAKASTCYTRKEGMFLKQWDMLVTPFFKRDYDSPEFFFELTPESKTDRELFSRYATHVLEHIAE